MLLLGASAARAQVATYTGQMIANPTGTLLFTWPGFNVSLANYTEAGLSVTCSSFDSGQGCTGGPLGGGCCRPSGFSAGGYYYGGPLQQLVSIKRADGGALSALEFQAGDYYNGCAYPGGDGIIYLWALVYSGGNFTSFDLNVPSGMYVGFQGVFDQVRIGAYSNAALRDQHIETYPQAIAMDNMRYVASGCPAFAAPTDVYACADGTKTFSVNAVGDATLSYQWQWQVPSQTDWTDVVEGANPAPTPLAFTATGAQAATLVRTGTLTGGSVVSYRCVVSNQCSSITGAPAILAITPAPTITDQPQDLPLCSGPATAFFSVQAVTTPADPGPFTYQWQRSSNGTTWSNIANGESTSGATSQYLAMQFEQTGDGAARYRCIVTNACSSTISSVATLSYGNAPTVYTQPSSSTVCPSGSAELDVDVGNQSLAAQWEFESPPNSGQYLPVSDYWTTDPATGLTFYSLGAASTGMSVQYITLGSHPPAIRFINALSNGCGSITTTPVTITLCAVDFDCSGDVAVQDLFAFLNGWFAGDPSADFDANPGLQVSDIFAFLNAWFAGCP
jgi:hypothetical protein